MRTPLGFISEFFKQPVWVILWVGALVAVNLLSLVFFDQALAKWIFGVFILQALAMMLMYTWFGFEKILGLAHILWVPLLIYIYLVLPHYSSDFLLYLVVLSVFNTVSLIFDSYDVYTYFRSRQQGI